MTNYDLVTCITTHFATVYWVVPVLNLLFFLLGAWIGAAFLGDNKP